MRRRSSVGCWSQSCISGVSAQHGSHRQLHHPRGRNVPAGQAEDGRGCLPDPCSSWEGYRLLTGPRASCSPHGVHHEGAKGTKVGEDGRWWMCLIPASCLLPPAHRQGRLVWSFAGAKRGIVRVSRPTGCTRGYALAPLAGLPGRERQVRSGNARIEGGNARGERGTRIGGTAGEGSSGFVWAARGTLNATTQSASGRIKSGFLPTKEPDTPEPDSCQTVKMCYTLPHEKHHPRPR